MTQQREPEHCGHQQQDLIESIRWMVNHPDIHQMLEQIEFDEPGILEKVLNRLQDARASRSPTPAQQQPPFKYYAISEEELDDVSYRSSKHQISDLILKIRSRRLYPPNNLPNPVENGADMGNAPKDAPNQPPADAVLDALMDDLEFLPSSEDKNGVVWITMRDVQEKIDERKAALRQHGEQG